MIGIILATVGVIAFIALIWLVRGLNSDKQGATRTKTQGEVITAPAPEPTEASLPEWAKSSAVPTFAAAERLHGFVVATWLIAAIGIAVCVFVGLTAPTESGACTYLGTESICAPDKTDWTGVYIAVSITSAILSIIGTFTIIACAVRLGILAADEAKSRR